jgi:ABC-type multidrug transport system permease subunit
MKFSIDKNLGKTTAKVSLGGFAIYAIVVSIFSLVWYVGTRIFFNGDFTFYQSLVITVLCGIAFQLFNILIVLSSIFKVLKKEDKGGSNELPA